MGAEETREIFKQTHDLAVSAHTVFDSIPQTSHIFGTEDLRCAMAAAGNQK